MSKRAHERARRHGYGTEGKMKVEMAVLVQDLREMNDLIDHPKIPAKKKGCKRNIGNPHEFVRIQLPEHAHWKNWTDYACKNCGKREYIYTNDWYDNTAYNDRKKKKLGL